MKAVALSGSLRKNSYNTKILRIAADIATQQGVDVTILDSTALDLPIFNQDVFDAGLPPAVEKLKKTVETADMLIIVSPEYNHSIPGGLKNAIDWLSRGKNSLSNKTAAILGASDGYVGTARMQTHLSTVLADLNVFVTRYPQVLIRKVDTLFDNNGTFTDEKTIQQISRLITKTIEFTQLLHKSGGDTNG